MKTNMMKQTIAQFSVMALLANYASAAIADDGLWTGNDWYDSALKVGVANGVPYSNDPAMQHRLNAPLSVDGDVSNDYMTRENVERVMSIIDET